MKMGVDSTFLHRENKLFRMRVKCGSEIKVFVNDIASAGEVWPFCERCESYVGVVPRLSDDQQNGKVLLS
jgi:hypothetical protein